MTTDLTSTSLSDFNQFLLKPRPIGLGLSNWQMSFGDASGQSFTAKRADGSIITRALAVLRASDRRVWCIDAAHTAASLNTGELSLLDAFRWLNDAGTIAAVSAPAEPHWTRPHRSTTDATAPRGAARTAVAVARYVSEAAAELPPRVRAAANGAAAHDRLWWPAQARGWRIDVAKLRGELQNAEIAVMQSHRELGIDVTRTFRDEDKHRVHEWLAQAGIEVRDLDGNPSLDRDHFDRALVPNTEDACLRWHLFKNARRAGSAVSKLREIDRALQGDRVFSRVIPRHTRTGRGSVVRPALQNLSAAQRPLLLADRGMTLVGLDLGQVEPRTAAGLSGDANLQTDLTVDIYEALAATLFGREEATANRQRAKTTLLSNLYGKGIRRLATDLRLSHQDARQLRDEMWNRYSELNKYGARLRHDMATGQPELTRAGRVIQPPSTGAYEVLNHRIQAEAADDFVACVDRVANILSPEALFLPIHDELVVQVPIHEAAHAADVLEHEMKYEINGVPVGGTATVMGRALKKT